MILQVDLYRHMRVKLNEPCVEQRDSVLDRGTTKYLDLTAANN